jgi:hypothetical protein
MARNWGSIRRWYRGPVAHTVAGLCGAAGLFLLAIPILANLLNPMVWWDAPIGVGIGIGFLALLIGDKEALFLQIGQSPSDVCIGFGQPSYIHECTHNLDIHCERAWTVENRGKHCDALFGKC